jgi:hypothetical protein
MFWFRRFVFDVSSQPHDEVIDRTRVPVFASQTSSSIDFRETARPMFDKKLTTRLPLHIADE